MRTVIKINVYFFFLFRFSNFHVFSFLQIPFYSLLQYQITQIGTSGLIKDSCPVILERIFFSLRTPPRSFPYSVRVLRNFALPLDLCQHPLSSRAGREGTSFYVRHWSLSEVLLNRETPGERRVTRGVRAHGHSRS